MEAVLTEVFSPKFVILYVWALSALFIHFRGRVRLKFSRQLTDHSTFMAPYNALVYLFSKVPNKPILKVEDFPELDAVRENWETIREEALALYEAGHIKKSDKYNDLAFNSFFKRGWKRFYFRWYGDYLPSARELCPKTTEILEKVPTINAAMFTLLSPRSMLVKHRDPFAGSLRYHLGLVTPNSEDCRIYIDGEPYHWRDGEDIVFDETYIHRAVNDTDETRIILFCDVTRPLRTPIARGINNFVIRRLVKATQSQNMEGEKVGIFNRLFHYVYQVRLPLKRLRKASKPTYYTLKYALLLGILAVIIWLL